jgi:multidrug resistance efflux pump
MAKSLRLFKSLAATTVIGVAVGFGAAPYVSNVIPSEAEAEAIPTLRQRRIICQGRVEAIHGKVDVMAQLSGELLEVCVKEGDRVEKGDLLARIDDRRAADQVAIAEANLDVARAELDRVLAGTGEEEIQAAARAVESAQALVEAQRARVERLKERRENTSQRPARARVSSPLTGPPEIGTGSAQRAGQQPSLEEASFQLQSLRKQYEAARKRYEALRRGPLPEDIDTAKAAVELAERRLDEAKTNHAYHRLEAPITGTVLKVHRHAGDSVHSGAPTPVVSIADIDRLRIRLEVQEVEAHELEVGQEGRFTVRGRSGHVGRLEIAQVVPLFGGKEQFQPDTSARVDTRILPMLCEVTSSDVSLYLNQRITAEFVPD